MFVSFYSYKGGVGRTQLLANAASYLCFYKHKKVLMLEWDLEAPGLHYYFGKKNIEISQEGLIELLEKYMSLAHRGTKLQSKDLPFFTEENIVKNLIVSKNGKGCVDLIPCANYTNADFTQKINDFDWREFMEMRDGNVFIDFLKTKLKEFKYDYVFIDSRTGISDYSGLCNILLPDVNVVVIAPTDQNFEGALRITKAISNHPYLTEGNRKPFILPILSRIDNQTEKSEIWIKRFEKEFSFTIEKLISKDLQQYSEQIFKDIYLPSTVLLYNRDMSVGENILFDQKAESKSAISSAIKYENIANFILELTDENFIDFESRLSIEFYEKYGINNNSKLQNYNNLIAQSNSFREALHIFEEMRRSGLKPNEISYNTLINKSQTFEEAQFFFEEMKKANLRPNEISYSTLINKSQTFEQAQFFFEEMKKVNLRPNEISYSTLINKAQTFEQAKFFFEEMRRVGLMPNEFSYSTLINKSQTFEQARMFYEEMRASGLIIDEISYNTLINKSQTFEQARFFFEEMRMSGLKPNEISYNTLINKAETFEDAKFFFDEMRMSGLIANEISYSTLINKTQTFEQAKIFFDEMKSGNLKPNEISYLTLINKAQTFEQAKFLFEEMKAQGIRIDEIVYATLIHKSARFDDAHYFYLEFQQKFPLRRDNFRSQKNYNYLFVALLKKVKNKKHWLFVQSEIMRLGLQLENYTQYFYESLAKRYS